MLNRFISLGCAVLTLWTSAARAADVGPVAKYLADDVVAVASIDLAKLDILKGFEALVDLGVVPEEFVSGERAKAIAAQMAYAEFPKQGARRAYILLRTSDVEHGGASWVIEVAEGSDASHVAALLEQALGIARSQRSVGNETALLPTKIKAAGNVVLAASSDAQMTMLQSASQAHPRAEATAAVESLLQADAGFIAFGDADSRRVLREMFPQLPAPFMEIDGKLLADGVAWASITANLPPQPTLGVTIEATNPAAAATLKESATKGLTMLKGLTLAAMASGEANAALAMPALATLNPEFHELRASITIGDDPQEVATLAKALAPAMSASRESARRSVAANNLKQISLAMILYHDAKGSFPPAAIRSAAGKPLLSWRVLLLPYLQQQDLFKQFHLDEPWDSEHNRPLAAQIPPFYAPPGQSQLKADGRTTFLVPTGKGTLFDGAEGLKLSAVSDGASNTLLAVEAPAERAVIWTQPADWEVDMADPTAGIKGAAEVKPGDMFGAAFCDGHVEFLPRDIDAAAVKAKLTIAGGERAP